MWYACLGIKISSSIDLLPLYFVIFPFSQSRHLKSGVLVEISDNPSFHFFVSFTVLVEEYLILWCHSSRSFIFWDSFDEILSFVVSNCSAFVVSIGVGTVAFSKGAILLLRPFDQCLGDWERSLSLFVADLIRVHLHVIGGLCLLLLADFLVFLNTDWPPWKFDALPALLPTLD